MLFLGIRSALFPLRTVRMLHNRAIDYYEVLGVDRHSNEKEIKLAYFKMAKKFHPDTNKTLDAKQMFVLVAEAYHVLSDEKRKAEYDDTGQSSQHYGGRAQGPERMSSDSTYTAEQMYTKIFDSEQFHVGDEIPREDFAVNFAGSDLSREYVATISFEESITGTNVLLHVRVAGICNKCLGSRAELGYTGNICPYCEGTGEETMKTGHIVGRRNCSYCNGEKIFFKFKCTECEGVGRILYERPYYVTVPAGSEHGQVFRLELDPALLNIPTEEVEKPRILYVTLNVKPSPFFTRDGIDLKSSIRLSPGMAALGGLIDYQGLTRCCDISIPVGTSSHTTIVVNQAGVHACDGHAGDHVLRTVIKVPKRMGWWQTRMFRKFALLDAPESGTINGIQNQMDHKFDVHVVDAEKTRNVVVESSLFNEDSLSWYERKQKEIKEKLEKWANFQFD